MRLPIRKLRCVGVRGFTVLEVCIAAAMLAVVAAGIMKATVAVERGRRAAARFDYASRELDNAMERYLHQPWDVITQQTADDLQPPKELLEQLPEARLETLVIEEDAATDALATKRVTMLLRWRNQASGDTPPLALTAWTFRGKETSE